MRLISLKENKNECEAHIIRNDIKWLIGVVLSGGIAAPIVLMFSLRITPAATAALKM